MMKLAMAAALVACALSPSAQAADLLQTNHYLCYGIQSAAGATIAPVKLQDQFGSGQAKVGKPRWLCNPVDKNGEGIENKEVHLVCYDVKPAIKPKAVTVSNQFGENKLTLAGAQLLCVPSKKQIQ